MAVTIVAISGKSGCGNTSVSRLLSERLRVRLINYTFRAMAIEKGVDFPGMLALANADFAYDRALDARQVELARERDCVIGSRLAIWLLPDATLKLYLAASPEARAERIRKREGGELADVLAFTKDRDARDHARYRTIYGIDNDDLSCADLVVNTELWNPESIVDMVELALRSARKPA